MDKKGETGVTQHEPVVATDAEPSPAPLQEASVASEGPRRASKKPAKPRATKSKPPAAPKAETKTVEASSVEAKTGEAKTGEPKKAAEPKPRAARTSRPPRSRAKTPPPPAVAANDASLEPAHVDAVPTPPPSKRAPRSRKSGEHTLYGQELNLPSVIVAPDVETPAAPPPEAPAIEPEAHAAPVLENTWDDHTRPATPRAIKSTPTPAPVTAAEREDDISIPPASTDAIDEHDERFFKQGELEERAAREHARAARRPTSSPSLADVFPPDPRLMQLASPAARARRARFEKYVKGAVAVSAILCLAALARVGLGGRSHDNEPVVAHAASQIEPVANAAVLPAAPKPEPAAATPPPESIPAPPPDPAADDSASDPAPEPTPEAVPTKTAAEEKKDARTSLERNKLADAIAAGERSVALDPADGEAWLILGAAYQEAGKGTEARRCFVSCTKEAKKGPIGECRLMLQ